MSKIALSLALACTFLLGAAASADARIVARRSSCKARSFKASKFSTAQRLRLRSSHRLHHVRLHRHGDKTKPVVTKPTKPTVTPEKPTVETKPQTQVTRQQVTMVGTTSGGRVAEVSNFTVVRDGKPGAKIVSSDGSSVRIEDFRLRRILQTGWDSRRGLNYSRR